MSDGPSSALAVDGGRVARMEGMVVKEEASWDLRTSLSYTLQVRWRAHERTSKHKVNHTNLL
jgi:hypothetical protein